MRLFSCLIVAVMHVYSGAVIDASHCVRKCTVDDSTDECWTQSLAYFTSAMHDAVRDYASALITIGRWRERNHDVVPVNFEKSLIYDIAMRDLEPLSKQDLLEVYTLILNKTIHAYGHFTQEEAVHLPSFQCPIPCNYDNTLWITLFGLMVAILMCVLLVIGCYMWKNYDAQKPGGPLIQMTRYQGD
ncbi:unnamed protein product [Owenia fusiformis]|uniref:Uncharacterized protein n=1 Tax=Owenia fusiformis TaxID=6347 RepID=A0A8J1XKC2_OWEFU|nr:unnamed protein product [Owenia fusiformis]